MAMEEKYIHGVHQEEQDRLRLLNKLTNKAYLEFIQVAPNSSILEIGSGLGIIAGSVAERDRTVQVTGVEYAQAQINQCPTHHPNLRFVQGDAQQLPFDDGKFDVVYGRYILEHLKNPLQALQEAYRVLKPGGIIYFQENAISLMRVFPECPSFQQVWAHFTTLQSQLGGDAEMGTKLYSLAYHAGFQQITPAFAQEIHYHEKGTLNGWVDNLIGNIQGATDALIQADLATSETIQQALQELEELKKYPEASSYFYWNRITAKK